MPPGRPGRRRRRRSWRRLWTRLARLAAGLFADREDFDPFGELELRRDGVFPGEVEMVAAAVAGVAVVADPAEGRRRLGSARGSAQRARRVIPRQLASHLLLQFSGDDVDREAVVVVGVFDVAAVAADVFAVRQRPRVAVADVDREALGDPAQVGEDAAVDHVAFFVRDRGRDRHDFAGRVGEARGGPARRRRDERPIVPLSEEGAATDDEKRAMRVEVSGPTVARIGRTQGCSLRIAIHR